MTSLITKDPIVLITPPSIFLADERVFVHLGILKIASILERADHPVHMIDLSGIQNYPDVIIDYLATNPHTKYIGITATTPQMPAVEAIVKVVRKQIPSARIILGGPHVTVTNAAKKLEQRKGIIGRAHAAFHRIADLVDVLIAGDGEDAIFAALQEAPPGIIDADEVASPMFLSSDRLDHEPFPARHLVDIHSYRYAIDGVKATSLIGQLGCPYACGFCSGRLSPSFRRIRTRSIQSLLDEIKEIYLRYGFRGLMLYDDELNVNTRMVDDMRALTKLQQELGVEFRLRGFIKANLFKEEQAQAMYEAGFRQICVGFESGSERILKNINKKSTRAQNTRCIEIAHKYGLKIKGFMSLGHPGESEQTIQETQKWLLEAQPDDFDCTVITTYPGTPYYDEAVHDHDTIWVYTAPNGDRLYAYEIDFVSCAQYYKGSIDSYESYVYTDYLTPSQIVQGRDWIERSVRDALKIPFYKNEPASRYEHSMGQLGMLPPAIFRQSAAQSVAC